MLQLYHFWRAHRRFEENRMPQNMDDPRVIKTRRGLREALIRLILEKGYDAVSIQDIAAEAETARITFYRHYTDKEDLLTDCLNVLYEELVKKTSGELKRGTPSVTLPARVFFEHLEAQEQLYRVLFSSLGTQAVLERMKVFLAQQVLTGLKAVLAQSRSNVPVEIVAYHLVSAQVGLGIWWLERGRPYPVDDMADITMRLSLQGVLGVLGIESPPEVSPQGRIENR